MILGIDDISIFKVFFDVVYEETDAVELACNSQGMKISVLDRSHTCFYEVFYDNTFFDLFDVDGAEVIVLDIDDLTKILKNTHKDDYLTLSSDDNRVVAKFEHDGNRRVFELIQYSDFGESPNPPSIPAECEVTISIDELNQSIKDLDIFKVGSCHMVCAEDKFVLGTKNDSSMNYNHIIEVDANGDGDSYYTVDYLKQIIKFKKINKEVILKFGNTIPLSWIVKNDSIRIQGLIAPRIEED